MEAAYEGTNRKVRNDHIRCVSEMIIGAGKR